MIIRVYTALHRFGIQLLQGNLYKPTRIQWNEKGILNTAHLGIWFLSHGHPCQDLFRMWHWGAWYLQGQSIDETNPPKATAQGLFSDRCFWCFPPQLAIKDTRTYFHVMMHQMNHTYIITYNIYIYMYMYMYMYIYIYTFISYPDDEAFFFCVFPIWAPRQVRPSARATCHVLHPHRWALSRWGHGRGFPGKFLENP